jgi:hypothetical protein
MYLVSASLKKKPRRRGVKSSQVKSTGVMGFAQLYYLMGEP